MIDTIEIDTSVDRNLRVKLAVVWDGACEAVSFFRVVPRSAVYPEISADCRVESLSSCEIRLYVAKFRLCTACVTNVRHGARAPRRQLNAGLRQPVPKS